MIQDWADALGLEEGTLINIIGTVVTVVVVLLLRRIARRIVAANMDEEETAYRTYKLINYAATSTFIVVTAIIWFEAFDNLPTYLGLVSAGIAIALADVLKNMAGWIYILVRKPFQVGDRIEVNDMKGDVVDIRLFRFSLMEIQNWVDAEQSTGRLVHVPNGLVFNHQVANYTEGFHYIWDEIPVLITFESDWKLAEQLMSEVLEKETPDIAGAAARSIRETAQRYSIRLGTLTPHVYLTVKDSGVLLTARYLVEARTRRGREDRIWRAVLDGFAAQPNIDLAYPTIRTYLHEASIRVDRG